MTFAAGISVVQIPFGLIDDTLAENTESIIMALAGGSGYTVAGGDATVNILDNDGSTNSTTPTYWITGDKDADETDGSNSGAGWFTVHRSGSTGSLTVGYSLPTDTAAPGSDYTGFGAGGGSVTFLDGQDFAYLDVNAIDDAAIEGKERVTVSINDSMSTTYLPDPTRRSAWIDILDNDRASVFGGTASISGLAWNDSANHNGVREAGEAGIGGRTVWLYETADDVNPAASATTDPTGHYAFTGLVAGSYTLELTGAIAPFRVGADAMIDSDFDPRILMTDAIALAPRQAVSHVDAGLLPDYVAPAAIRGTVWDDSADLDGIRESGEIGVMGQAVLLHGADGSTLATATTDEDGRYEFTDLAPGDYTVEFAGELTDKDIGGDETIDSDADWATGFTDGITPVARETFAWVDAGMTAPFVQIGGGNGANPNPPVFQGENTPGKYQFNVTRGAAKGTEIGSVLATDMDGDRLRYSIIAGDPNGYFEVRKQGYTIATLALKSAVPPAVTGPLIIQIEVRDRLSGGSSAFTEVTVNILPRVEMTGTDVIATKAKGANQTQDDNFKITLDRTGSAAEIAAPLTVNVRAKWGTAGRADLDAGTQALFNPQDVMAVTFAAGETKKTITLDANHAAAVGPNDRLKKFSLEIMPATNYASPAGPGMTQELTIAPAMTLFAGQNVDPKFRDTRVAAK